MAKKILYYKDELNDDFLNDHLEERPLPEGYKYVRKNPAWYIFSFVIYYIVAIPVLWIIDKVWYGMRIHGKSKIWKMRGGFFIYANHTQSVHDAFTPCWASFPKMNYTIVNRSAISVSPLAVLVELLGGVPMPDGHESFKRFYKALESRCKSGSTITIYPERHVWPWYTGIRNFSATSFAYPVRWNMPVFALATTYRSRWIFKKCHPLIDVTVGGPFFPDKSLPEKAARQKLRDEVYGFLCSQADKSGNIAWWEYRKADGGSV